MIQPPTAYNCPVSFLNYLDRQIRRNIWIYFLVRKLAVKICRIFPLEQGFEILKYIEPASFKLPALDVGSNDGTSIQIMRHFMPEINIIAFDPVIEPRVKTKSLVFWDLGISNQEGTKEIFIPQIHGHTLSQYSSIDLNNVYSEIARDFGIGRDQVTVVNKSIRVVKIDSLNLLPFFVKLDIEGHELEALKGMQRTIEFSKPVIMAEVTSMDAWRQINNWLAELDYSCRNPSGNRSFKEIQFNQKIRNYLWLPDRPSNTWHYKKNHLHK